MKTLLLLLATLALPGAAQANVILADKLSGTGENVIADTVGTNSATGHLNTSTDVVDYTGISTGFTGASHGNDIKISDTVGLTWNVFLPDGTTPVGTTEQVFSLKGTGDISLIVQATDAMGNAEMPFSFDLGTIDPTNQSGFTLTTMDGEIMGAFVLLDTGGVGCTTLAPCTITDFEHNRIIAANSPLAATPLPGAMWMFAGGLGLLGFVTGRNNKPAVSAFV